MQDRRRRGRLPDPRQGVGRTRAHAGYAGGAAIGRGIFTLLMILLTMTYAYDIFEANEGTVVLDE